eukprot:Skav234859  [mRNA]  locus=scaffold840:117067:124884:- [translate_table: standard]
MTGKFDCTSLLLSAGARVNLRNARGKTALDMARETGAPMSIVSLAAGSAQSMTGGDWLKLAPFGSWPLRLGRASNTPAVFGSWGRWCSPNRLAEMEESKVAEFKSIGGQRTLVSKKQMGHSGSLPSLTPRFAFPGDELRRGEVGGGEAGPRGLRGSGATGAQQGLQLLRHQ